MATAATATMNQASLSLHGKGSRKLSHFVGPASEDEHTVGHRATRTSSAPAQGSHFLTPRSYRQRCLMEPQRARQGCNPVTSSSTVDRGVRLASLPRRPPDMSAPAGGWTHDRVRDATGNYIEGK